MNVFLLAVCFLIFQLCVWSCQFVWSCGSLTRKSWEWDGVRERDCLAETLSVRERDCLAETLSMRERDCLAENLSMRERDCLAEILSVRERDCLAETLSVRETDCLAETLSVRERDCLAETERERKRLFSWDSKHDRKRLSEVWNLYRFPCHVTGSERKIYFWNSRWNSRCADVIENTCTCPIRLPILFDSFWCLTIFV